MRKLLIRFNQGYKRRGIQISTVIALKIKKLNFPKFADGHSISMVSQQESHEILEPISKDPLRLDARDLKKNR